MTCTCNGTGKRLGSDYLDCSQCPAADERTAFEASMKIGNLSSMMRDLFWLARQDGVRQERAIAAENLSRVAELYAVGDSGARMALADEIARVTK